MFILVYVLVIVLCVSVIISFRMNPFCLKVYIVFIIFISVLVVMILVHQDVVNELFLNLFDIL